MKVVALISGGKDSCFNMMHVVAEGHEIVALGNLLPASSDTDELDSYMYQTVGHEAIGLYSEAMELPLFRRKITGTPRTVKLHYEPSHRDEVEDLYLLLQEIKEKIYFDAVATGAILSDYQRIRVESVCSRLGVTSLSYLWRRNQKELLQEMIDCRLEAILIKTAALGLEPRKHLGRSLSSMQKTLHELSEKYGCHICGEGGEFETFTLNCPLFKKRIVIDESEVIIHSDDYFAPVGYLKLKKMHLEAKGVDAISYTDSMPLMTSAKWRSSFLSRKATMNDGKEMENTINATVTWKATQKKYNSRPKPQIHHHGRYLVISNLLGQVTGEPDEAFIKDSVFHVLQTLEDLLQEHSHELNDVCYIQLNVADMSHYKYINEVYSKFFKTVPPARSCIGCLNRTDDGDGEQYILQAYCISCNNPSSKTTMHVQGISHWAPANIGPFSQCVMADNLMFISGTIALIPGNMQLISDDAGTQACLALHHIKKVISAMKEGNGPEDLLQCICYVTKEDIEAVKTCWKILSTESCSSQLCEPLYLVVNELPKGAIAEWQGTACKKNESSIAKQNKCSNFRSVDYQMSIAKCVCDAAATYMFTCSRGIGDSSILDLKTGLEHLLEQLCKCLKEYDLSIDDVIQASLFFTGNGITPQVVQGVWEDLPIAFNVTCVRVGHISHGDLTACLSCACLICPGK